MESFENILDDERISEVVVVDDCSDEEIYNKVKHAVKEMDKVFLHRNFVNIGMGANKARAIELAKNEWVLLLDSDNVVKSDYLDALYNVPLFQADEYMMYCPEWAMPAFDYREFSGCFVDKYNIRDFIDENLFDCLLNTCNAVFNRRAYLEVYESSVEHVASDTIWFLYLWLKKGHAFHIVEGMRYFHRQHEGSGFLKDVDYNLRKSSELKELIRNL